MTADSVRAPANTAAPGATRLLEIGTAVWRRAGWWIVYLPVPLLALWGVLFRSGWPVNHELFIHFERVEAFRRAYLAGDWFPTWTPFAENLHGDALPFFYHRLFNTVGSLFAVAIGSSYYATKISVYLVMLVGLWGTDRAVDSMGGSRTQRFVGACLVVFSNYSLTDWWIRGSTAEFTAFMVLPWFFHYLIRLIDGRKGGIGLGLATGALFYAHNMIFFFTLLMLVLVLIGQAPFLGKDKARWMFLLRQLVIAGLVCALVAGPYAVAIALVGPRFSLNALYVWSPIRQLTPFHWYFLDEKYEWATLWRIEIGRPLLVALIVLVALAIVFRARVNARLLVALAISIAFCMYLQGRVAIPFYEKFPGAMFLGFPWRLLCNITVALVLALCHLADAVARSPRAAHKRVRWLGEVAIGLALLFQGAFAVAAQRPNPKHHYPRAEIESHLQNLNIGTVGEYLPTQVGGRRGVPGIEPFISARGCAAVKVDGRDDLATTVHIKRLHIAVTSAAGCDVLINQFVNPFIGVESAAAIRVDESPKHTMVVHVPAGAVDVTVFRRSLLAVTWHELAARFKK